MTACCRPVWPLSIALLLAGCAEEGEPPGDDAGGPQPSVMPAIHVDQIATLVQRDDLIEAYHASVDACRQANLPTVALGPGEIEKLFTTRLERWLGEGRAAYRVEHFRYTMGQLEKNEHCMFRLISTGHHLMIDGTGARGIDLDTNESFERVPLAERDARWLNRSPAREKMPAEALPSTAAGHPCTQLRNIFGYEGATTCTWSGGAQWGFATMSPGLLSVHSASHQDIFEVIILEQDGSGSLPDTIRTLAFSVGGELDGAAMHPRSARAWPAKKPFQP